ncbi:MAG TPA: ABC transporter permease [bacterium]|nr:ABC transporter permease [bacterium]
MTSERLWPLIATGLAIVMGGALVAGFGHDPIAAYGSLLAGAFGSGYAVATTLARALPLMLAGLAVALSFQSGLFNIGASGQFWLGAIAAAWVGFRVQAPTWVHLPGALVAGTVAGAAWAAIVPGLAKAYRGANEVITTLMMTYAAVYFGHYLIEGGPMQAPGFVPQSPEIAASATLPTLVLGSQLSWGLVLAPLAAVAVWFLMQRTALGFALRVTGLNPRAARYAGINPAWAVLTALALSGAIAGFAGAVQVLGVDHRLYDSFGTEAGFTGIVVALLARNNPFGVLVAAVLFGALASGGNTMQLNAGVPFHLVDVIQGLIIFFIAAEGLLRYVRPTRPALSRRPT